MKRIYNLAHDAPDSRDFLHVTALSTAPLPSKADLRPTMPPIYDQGQLGSCTGNCYAAILDFVHKLDGGQFINPSRLFIYWFERFLEGTTKQDVGASMRDGAKVLNVYGACKETTVPYDIAKFTVKPSKSAIVEALNYQATIYERVAQSLTSLKTVLANGLPVAIGISVYASFESASVARTGIVPLPNTRKESLLGGHAVAIVGYDDAAQVFIVRNSWGTGWGMAGYFTMPYAYVINPKLASDFWCVSKAE